MGAVMRIRRAYVGPSISTREAWPTLRTMGPREYPFVPKSAAKLLPGEFWAIPLSDGTFACGRVIQVKPKRRLGSTSRVMFLAGLLDWHARAAPTNESIAGAACLAQGQAHFKTITASGGRILGVRPLEADGIEPWTFRGARVHVNSHVLRGLDPLRPQRPSDEALPILSTWGYRVPVVLAEKRWLRRPGPRR